MTQTMTALYDTRGAAETAQELLLALNISQADISIRGAELDTDAEAAPVVEEPGIFAAIADFFMPDDDRHAYSEGVRRGGYLLAVQVPAGMENEVSDALETADPVDLDERSQAWRQEGWSGVSTAGAAEVADEVYGDAGMHRESDIPQVAGSGGLPGTPMAPIATPAAGVTDAPRRGDDTVQLAEEELKVGKRTTEGGAVRIRTYVAERPVEEKVDLRSERVTLDRRPVDRTVELGADAFQPRTIEAVERGEEAVISKTARVTEEIGLRKDVDTRTETIRDTVRSTKAEIEDDRAEPDPKRDPGV